MTTCKDVHAFLSQVSAKNVTSTLSTTDTALLSQLGLVQVLTADQYRELASTVQALGAEQQSVTAEAAQRAAAAEETGHDERATHSVLFRFEGKQKRAAKLQRAAADEARLKSLESDLAARQAKLGQLVAERSLLDTVTPYGDQYVGLTGLGALELRNLGVRLYRVSDTEFGTYWEQSQRITQELTNLAAASADYYMRLAMGIAGQERSHLWAVAIGLAKAQPDAVQGSSTFLNIYAGVTGLSGNLENHLLASEILFCLPRPLSEEYPTLLQVLQATERATVPAESALGVASILLLGQRADGSIATPNLTEYLRLTRSYESAALLAIVNLPVAELAAKFQSIRAMFTQWGYQASEDVELSSAYLAVSEVPVEGISTKLAIIAKGMSAYLQYPLVAASVLASLSTLEANETLNLLEHAYDIMGRRATGMSQAELICLGVRLLHGIRNELVGPLDATAAVPKVAPDVYGPRFYFVPIIVARYSYFSTFSGVGGAHPGHVHGFGGGGGGFVG